MQLSDHDIRKLSAYVESFRDLIEPHWSRDILYRNFKPRTGDAKSAGYCGPSSVLLFKYLTELYPKYTFSVAVGKVYRDKIELVRGKHVWVVLHLGLAGAVVIDITADQSCPRINKGKIVIEDSDTLAKEGINYIAYRLAYTLESVDSSPRRRAELLDAKIKS